MHPVVTHGFNLLLLGARMVIETKQTSLLASEKEDWVKNTVDIKTTSLYYNTVYKKFTKYKHFIIKFSFCIVSLTHKL
jgi:hypothetical protein